MIAQRKHSGFMKHFVLGHKAFMKSDCHLVLYPQEEAYMGQRTMSRNVPYLSLSWLTGEFFSPITTSLDSVWMEFLDMKWSTHLSGNTEKFSLKLHAPVATSSLWISYTQRPADKKRYHYIGRINWPWSTVKKRVDFHIEGRKEYVLNPDDPFGRSWHSHAS